MPYFYQSERLALRPIRKEDLPFMRSLHMNEEIMKYIGSGVPRTEEQSLVAMERSLEIEKEDARLGSWVLELKSGSSPIGLLIIRQPATKEKIEGLEIGYIVAPLQWGKGYAQEATRAMIKYAYQHFGQVRIVALIEPNNLASRNVLLKTGFSSNGITDFVDPTNGELHVTEVLEIPVKN